MTAPNPSEEAHSPLRKFIDLHPETDDFEEAVLDGLKGSPKTLPCKFFYDRDGSELFDRITDLPEYYPTRTEIGLLRRHAFEIAELMGPGCHVVEFGSGSSAKVPILLNALDQPAAYTGVDISRDFLISSCQSLARDFPEIDVMAVCADYTQPFPVPDPPKDPNARRVGFFPGSTIGNFAPAEASGFLATAAGILGAGGGLLIGVDLRKSTDILIPAYDDAAGVTAAFNMNLLSRINGELGADFDLGAFRHEARYNDVHGRIEMHLVSTENQSVTINGNRFQFADAETIHTENSYKFTLEGVAAIATDAGFDVERQWTDDADLFSIHFLRVS